MAPLPLGNQVAFHSLSVSGTSLFLFGGNTGTGSFSSALLVYNSGKSRDRVIRTEFYLQKNFFSPFFFFFFCRPPHSPKTNREQHLASAIDEFWSSRARGTFVQCDRGAINRGGGGLGSTAWCCQMCGATPLQRERGHCVHPPMRQVVPLEPAICMWRSKDPPPIHCAFTGAPPL